MSYHRLGKCIVAVILIALLVTGCVMTCLKWNIITSWFTHQKTYIQDDLQKEYDHGYQDGNRTHKDDQDKINYYKNLINQYLKDIDNLNKTVADYLKQIDDLKKSDHDESELIVILKKQVEQLNKLVSELQTKIDYYQSIINNYKPAGDITITFYVQGNIFVVKYVKPGEKVTDVSNPIDTNNVKFNYWTVDDNRISLNDYVFQVDTKVIANVTLYYDVAFMIDNVVVNTQYVVDGGYPSAYTPLIKDTTYRYVGWTIDKINIIDITTQVVHSNVTYYAYLVKYDLIDNDMDLSNDIANVMCQYHADGCYDYDVDIDNLDVKCNNIDIQFDHVIIRVLGLLNNLVNYYYGYDDNDVIGWHKFNSIIEISNLRFAPFICHYGDNVLYHDNNNNIMINMSCIINNTLHMKVINKYHGVTPIAIRHTYIFNLFVTDLKQY